MSATRLNAVFDTSHHGPQHPFKEAGVVANSLDRHPQCDSEVSLLCQQELHTQTNSVALARKRTIPTERPPYVGEVSANFCGRVVSTTDPHGRILGFLDRSRYYFFEVAPQLYSQGRVDPVPDPRLLRKSGRFYVATEDSYLSSVEAMQWVLLYLPIGY
jgi:hypothetical protein